VIFCALSLIFSLGLPLANLGVFSDDGERINVSKTIDNGIFIHYVRAHAEVRCSAVLNAGAPFDSAGWMPAQ
jgi:hypothetical protein